MCHPLVAFGIDVVVGAEGPHVQHQLGALIDDGTPVARKRQAVLLALEEILAHLGPDRLEDEAHVRRDGVVAQHRVPGLEIVVEADEGEEEGKDEPDADPP